MRDANGDRDRKGVASDKRAAGNVTFPFCIYTPEHRPPSIILLSLQTAIVVKIEVELVGVRDGCIMVCLPGRPCVWPRRNDEARARICVSVCVCVCVCPHVAYVVRYAEKWSQWAIDGVARCLG